MKSGLGLLGTTQTSDLSPQISKLGVFSGKYSQLLPETETAKLGDYA